MDLVAKELGPEADVKLSVVAGNLVLASAYAGKGAGAKLEVSVSSDYFIDELAKLIPGSIDDAIFAVLKSALKSL